MKRAAQVPRTVHDAHDFDAVVDGLVQDQLVSNGKASQTFQNLGPRRPGVREACEQAEPLVDRVDQSKGGLFAVTSDEEEDLPHVRFGGGRAKDTWHSGGFRPRQVFAQAPLDVGRVPRLRLTPRGLLCCDRDERAKLCDVVSGPFFLKLRLRKQVIDGGSGGRVGAGLHLRLDKPLHLRIEIDLHGDIVPRPRSGVAFKHEGRPR